MAKAKTSFITVDGNEATTIGAFAFTEVSAIYPITPSSPMSEHMDAWMAKGKSNVFGDPVTVVEMQSEGGAAGAVHGALQGGTLSTTFTASQGLLLMIPNIYKCVGEMLPAVFHIAARSLATRSLSIFGDHQDIYAVRQTGITMIASHSVQEAADLAPMAHLLAINSSAPVLHFFDGFRTSHEIQKVEIADMKEYLPLLDKDQLAAFRARALNPHTNPVVRGGNENDDIYFQGREAQNSHFNKIADMSADLFAKISELTGREYAPFTYYGHPQADRVIVAMGSVTETAKETIDVLLARGEKVGMIKVHLYRPFSAKHLISKLPATVKKVAVLDRTKEQGAPGEPLFLDVANVLRTERPDIQVVIGGRYGLSSKDVQPKHVKSVFDHLTTEKPFTGFVVGIVDDVTFLSLPVDEEFSVSNDSTSCLFYGLGSDGTVSANKNSIKIIGDKTDLYSQAYFAYDSKKAGQATRSNLRFGKSPIRSPYLIREADFISCSLDNYIFKFDMLRNLKKGGTFLLNTSFTKEELIARMPNKFKKQLAERKARLFIINANKLAEEIGMGRRTNTILQSAFFKLNPQIMDYAVALEYMKEFAQKSYGKKGEDIVRLNEMAIDRGAESLEEVAIDPEWVNLKVSGRKLNSEDEYSDFYMDSINSLEGYDLPTSIFTKHGLLDGSIKHNVAYNERRTIASEVPTWDKDNCIQCGRCVYVCPHSTIRAFLLTEEEMKNAPEIMKNDVLQAVGPGVGHLKYKIQVTPDNCVGCSLCVVECPGKGPGKKALEMVDVKTQLDQVPAADYLYKKITYKSQFFPISTVKGAQFLRPYFEVSGACAGCGETPYYRLATQLFGYDMIIANATGCSSIYGAPTPSTPFTTDENNEGPAWANSLFEDNAEFGYGIRMAQKYKQDRVIAIMNKYLDQVEPELKAVLEQFLVNPRDRALGRKLRPEILRLCEASKCEGIKDVIKYKGDLIRKSMWIIGGDGWSYDIGFGGLDHVVASGEDVNILILDTEVYSNTGGQASKSSQTGAIAKFASGGKATAKKDMAQILMAYDHVYVAQVAMGANNMQVIKAFQEAESYDGPSVIIAYSPCIEHGIKGGLMNHQISEKKAVEAGYFNIFRRDPRLAEQGKNPLILDMKEPNFETYNEFLLTETRFSQLSTINPDNVEELLTLSKKYAKRRWLKLKEQASLPGQPVE